MVKALRTLRTERIWQTTAERDGLISCVWRLSFGARGLVARTQSLPDSVGPRHACGACRPPEHPALTLDARPSCDPRSNCFLRPVNLLAETEAYPKVPEIKAGIFRVMCLAAKGHGQAFSASLPPPIRLASTWRAL